MIAALDLFCGGAGGWGLFQVGRDDRRRLVALAQDFGQLVGDLGRQVLRLQPLRDRQRIDAPARMRQPG